MGFNSGFKGLTLGTFYRSLAHSSWDTLYVYFALFYVYVYSMYVPMSGPQYQHFDYTMHFATLHTTPYIHILRF